MVGTLASAFLKARSFMRVRACKPARINSLFLISTPSSSARFLDSPICSNSLLGMVKLSRTTLTFLSFKGFAGLAADLLATDLFAADLGAVVLTSTGAGVGAGVLGLAFAGDATFRGALRAAWVGAAFVAALREGAFLADVSALAVTVVWVFMVINIEN